eukprot:NODE_825_length_3678_cov_0.558536.p1 type:complete len:528 gc:universal NODE_825_length_3678_cov_0.558536:561-2144(+)
MLLSTLYGYSTAACSTDTPVCTDICVNILKSGGNAIDAAIAATLCIGTVSSQASGIGGGGFAVIDYHHDVHFVNFREMAPAKAHKNMFVNATDAQRGIKSIAIPGELKGLYEMHYKFGHLKWYELVSPSIKLARDGFYVTPHLAKILRRVEQYVLADAGMRQIYTKIVDHKLQLVKEGDFIRRPNFATTLSIIGEFNSHEFYHGSLLDQMIQFITKKGGILTRSDFESYKTEWHKPLSFKFKNYDVYTGMAPSGGPLLAMMLKLSEYYPNISIHQQIEIMKFAYAKRSQFGDPKFIHNVTQLTSTITSSAFLNSIHGKITDKTHLPEYYDSDYQYFEDHGTTHLTVLDKDGNSVSLTSTVNLEFGSVLMDPVSGIIFNDQLDDFSIPNQKNAFDVMPSYVNFIEPFKRPQSSSCPMIMKLNGKFVATIGGSGGSRITSAVFQVILAVINGTHLNDAVQMSRLHHQLYPNYIETENDLSTQLSNELTSTGHLLKNIGMTFSAVQGIWLLNGEIQAAADKRKHGKACGY